MKNIKRIVSLFLVVLTLTLSSFTFSASAATSSVVTAAIFNKLPIVTYAMPLSGASRVHSYSDYTLSTQTPGYYIDSYTDQITITQISADGKAVLVTYPSSSSSTGYRSRWFRTEDVIGLTTISITPCTASSKFTTYRMSSASGLKSYGSLATGDDCVVIGSRTVGGKTCYVYVYPISTGTYNKVSGVKYKIGLTTTAPKSATTTTTITPSSSTLAVKQRLMQIGTGTLTYNNSTVLSLNKTFVGTRSSEECKGYAKDLYYLCFGITPSSTQAKPNNYLLNTTNGMTLIGSVSSRKENDVKDLFQSAKPGDFIQIRRSHGGSHSAILYSVSETGIKVMEANLDGKNTIYGSTYTWAELCSSNAAMSVYTATSYKLS